MVSEDGACSTYEDRADVNIIVEVVAEVVVQEAMLRSGFVELSCVFCIMAELEFN